MQRLLRGLAAATIIVAGASMHVQTAQAEASWFHGCWFTPPNPPACDSCADNCNSGQRCCLILPF